MPYNKGLVENSEMFMNVWAEKKDYVTKISGRGRGGTPTVKRGSVLCALENTKTEPGVTQQRSHSTQTLTPPHHHSTPTWLSQATTPMVSLSPWVRYKVEAKVV